MAQRHGVPEVNQSNSVEEVVAELRQFVAERDWAQFHDSKNLAMAVASEAGELLSLYRWIPNQDSDDWSADPENRTKVETEAADVGIALLLFCDRLGIDLTGAMKAKISVNRTNYPVEKSRGRSERPLDG